MSSTRNMLCALLPLLMLFTSVVCVASAAESCCKKCGCTEKVKKKLCLIRTYEEIEIPIYECAPEPAFFPCRGKICYDQYRCDVFTELYKPSACGNGACGNGACSECVITLLGDITCNTICPPYQPTMLHCECYTESGCVTLYGAKEAGDHDSRCIKRPTMRMCKKRVPVVKWVTIPVCDDCCAKR